MTIKTLAKKAITAVALPLIAYAGMTFFSKADAQEVEKPEQKQEEPQDFEDIETLEDRAVRQNVFGYPITKPELNGKNGSKIQYGQKGADLKGNSTKGSVGISSGQFNTSGTWRSDRTKEGIGIKLSDKPMPGILEDEDIESEKNFDYMTASVSFLFPRIQDNSPLELQRIEFFYNSGSLNEESDKKELFESIDPFFRELFDATASYELKQKIKFSGLLEADFKNAILQLALFKKSLERTDSLYDFREIEDFFDSSISQRTVTEETDEEINTKGYFIGGEYRGFGVDELNALGIEILIQKIERDEVTVHSERETGLPDVDWSTYSDEGSGTISQYGLNFVLLDDHILAGISRLSENKEGDSQIMGELHGTTSLGSDKKDVNYEAGASLFTNPLGKVEGGAALFVGDIGKREALNALRYLSKLKTNPFNPRGREWDARIEFGLSLLDRLANDKSDTFGFISAFTHKVEDDYHGYISAGVWYQGSKAVFSTDINSDFPRFAFDFEVPVFYNVLGENDCITLGGAVDAIMDTDTQDIGMEGTGLIQYRVDLK